MNQNDFRALLSAKTTTQNASNAGTRVSGSGSFGGKRNMTSTDLDEIRRLSKKPKKKSKRPNKAGTNDDTNDDNDSSAVHKPAASVYRDRAAERRQGKGSDMVDATEFAHLDVEQTKFLGGDVAHTHLVKGLDFALLSQLKREKEKLLQATAAHRQVQQQQQQQQPLTTATSDTLTFTTRVGRLVYFHAVQSLASAATTTSELFLPGRMYYTFPLTSANEADQPPIIVQRSRADCHALYGNPDDDDEVAVVSGLVDEDVIARVRDALSGLSTRHKKLRRKKKATDDEDDEKDAEQTVAASAVVESEDDDDIFPDVGEYVPIHARSDSSSAMEDTTNEIPAVVDSEQLRSESESITRSSVVAAAGGGGYFANLSASLSAAALAEQQAARAAEHAWHQTIQNVVHATQQQTAKQQQTDADVKRGMDEYEECYPDYQAAASAIDSEDDEDEVRRKGADRDKDDNDGGATDAAVATEKTRRRKQKQGNKLTNDLDKINKLLDAKKTAGAPIAASSTT